MAPTRRAVVGLAAAFVACLPATSQAAGISSVLITPTPGAVWDYVDSSDCIATDGSLWSSIVYVNVDVHRSLNISGEVRNAGGNLFPNQPVTIFMAGYRPGENLHPRTLRRTLSASDGSFKLLTPPLTRNVFVWAQLDTGLQGGLTQRCTPVMWPLLPGISDPIVVDVRPVLRIGRKTTTRGKKLTVSAVLDAADPTHAGKVVLQRRVGKSWRRAQTLHPGSTGRMKIRLSFSRSGPYRFRLLFTPRKGSTDYVVGAERQFSVRVALPTPRRPKVAPAVSYTPGPALVIPDRRHGIPCPPLLPKCHP
jgi:hypothetical protein